MVAGEVGDERVEEAGGGGESGNQDERRAPAGLLEVDQSDLLPKIDVIMTTNVSQCFAAHDLRRHMPTQA
ncbi:hypothetical protein GCM10009738_16520 [Kitasatospora viridis]